MLQSDQKDLNGENDNYIELTSLMRLICEFMLFLKIFVTHWCNFLRFDCNYSVDIEENGCSFNILDLTFEYRFKNKVLIDNTFLLLYYYY